MNMHLDLVFVVNRREVLQPHLCFASKNLQHTVVKTPTKLSKPSVNIRISKPSISCQENSFVGSTIGATATALAHDQSSHLDDPWASPTRNEMNGPQPGVVVVVVLEQSTQSSGWTSAWCYGGRVGTVRNLAHVTVISCLRWLDKVH